MSISPLHDEKKEKFNHLYNLALTCLDKVFEKNMNFEVQEAKEKLVLQCSVKNLFILQDYKPFRKEKIVELIEKSNIPAKKLLDFKMIKELINKELLIANDTFKIKKRI